MQQQTAYENSETEGSESSPRRPFQWWRRGRRIAFVACVLGAGVVLSAAPFIRAKPASKGNSLPQKVAGGEGNRPPGDEEVRIPLLEVVRFKERQWFVEELEASREGDANAMLRVAKMYMHGAGCQKDIGMAQEWLRKARYLGVYCTLEELYAGDDWQEEKARAAAAARRAQKRDMAMGASAAARQQSMSGAGR